MLAPKRWGQCFRAYHPAFWDMEFYLRGDGERANSTDALYLTNIQQLYERDAVAGDDSEPDIITAGLGPRPPSQTLQPDGFAPRILARGGPVFVANDEAHHAHDEESEWNRGIRRLHAVLIPAGDGPDKSGTPESLTRQGAAGVLHLDVSATPRYSKGALFTWTVFDYPLKQAIIDNVTKRPIEGIMQGVKERRPISPACVIKPT